MACLPSGPGKGMTESMYRPACNKLTKKPYLNRPVILPREVGRNGEAEALVAQPGDPPPRRLVDNLQLGPAATALCPRRRWPPLPGPQSHVARHHVHRASSNHHP